MKDLNPDSGCPVQNPKPACASAKAVAAAPPILVSATQVTSATGNFGTTLRRCVACNPMYLLSAALLLYGFYLVSADSGFLPNEVAKLSFNLSSLQLYEMLVVITAIFLATRAVWYDSTLLVGLENLLLLVPFILVSQAALIDAHLVWVLCVAAGGLAVTRLALLRRFISELNFPARLLGVGVVLLAVNAALPVVYRVLHETKFGTKPDWGVAFQTNQFVWWLVLPVLCALATVVPFRPGTGELWPQRRWLPLGFFASWLIGTGTHLYCLGYVYDFTLRAELLAPAIWTLLWVFSARAAEWLRGVSPEWRNALWILPALATLLAASPAGKEVFLTLTILNVLLYAVVYYRHRALPAVHLLLISLVALLAGLPESWSRSLASDFTREKLVAGAAVVYLLGALALSRNPKMGILGALITAIAVAIGFQNNDTTHWALQSSLVFLLLHSLRWNDGVEDGAKVVRRLAALAWMAHSFIWTAAYDAGWRVCGVALLVLAVYLASRWVQGRWGALVVAVPALAVMFAEPVHLASTGLRATPGGLLAVIGSFVLFGLGTLVATSKHRWQTRGNTLPQGPSSHAAAGRVQG